MKFPMPLPSVYRLALVLSLLGVALALGAVGFESIEWAPPLLALLTSALVCVVVWRYAAHTLMKRLDTLMKRLDPLRILTSALYAARALIKRL